MLTPSGGDIPALPVNIPGERAPWPARVRSRALLGPTRPGTKAPLPCGMPTTPAHERTRRSGHLSQAICPNDPTRCVGNPEHVEGRTNEPGHREIERTQLAGNPEHVGGRTNEPSHRDIRTSPSAPLPWTWAEPADATRAHERTRRSRNLDHVEISAAKRTRQASQACNHARTNPTRRAPERRAGP